MSMPFLDRPSTYRNIHQNSGRGLGLLSLSCRLKFKARALSSVIRAFGFGLVIRT